jgi:hypothetical protein
LLNSQDEQKKIEDMQNKEKQVKLMLELAKIRGGSLEQKPVETAEGGGQ